MSLKSETAMLRICGNCIHANRRLESHEVQFLIRKAYLKQHYLANLRRYANPLRDKRVLCRKENINVSPLEEACAFWRPSLSPEMVLKQYKTSRRLS